MYFSWVGILIHFCSIHVFHDMYPRFLKTEITDITVSQFWYPLLEKQCDIVLEYSDCHPSSVCNISALIFLTPVLWFVMMTYVSKVHLFASATMYQLMGFPWWRHQMETFSALLALCAGNSPVTGSIPAQRPVTRSFDVFFDMRPNKRLSKQLWGCWF